MTSIITHTVTAIASSASPSSTVRAAPQGGVLDGLNPTHYNSANPIVLFIIQVSFLFNVFVVLCGF